MPLPESPDVLLDAWRGALGNALAEERERWQQGQALVEARAARTIAELQSRVFELEHKLEQLAQQKLLDLTVMVQERLTTLRDGRDGVPGESIKGDRGEQGLSGVSIIGPPGPQGPQGLQGLQGETGHGIEGKIGPQGQKGEKGEKGDRGSDGSRGEAGAQGQQGPQGAQGKDGLSIIGPEGPRGSQGERGPSGRDGAVGIQGRDGAIGPPGPVGPTGLRGERGREGIGLTGPAGPTGARGDKGEPGITGPMGPPGRLPRVKQWTPDTVFYDGAVVRFERGTYQALKDTSQRPGSGEDWICIAAGGLDAKSPKVRGTYDPEASYTELDIVASNGASFIARCDKPGPLPGDGWQMIAKQGQRGIAGERGSRGEQGERGERGLPGAAAVTIKSWSIERKTFRAFPVMSDGMRGPVLELRELFEQFQSDSDG